MGAACGHHDHNQGAHGHSGGPRHDHGDVAVFAGKDPAFRRVLWLVIVLNAGMAAVEIAAGSIGDSMALQADALDFIGNVAVLTAAALVGWTATPWADLVVAIGMASLFAWSSVAILRQARAELHVAA